MPCYLFTYHAHASWMPDHPRGFVKRDKGIQSSNKALAQKYRSNLKQRPIRFDARAQKLIVFETVAACEHQTIRCHFIATESTHVHVLVSWTIDRTWEIVRAKLRESLSRRLNQELERCLWFSKSPSRKRVTDQKHFDYLIRTYLPKHSGWKWSEGIGVFK